MNVAVAYDDEYVAIKARLLAEALQLPLNQQAPILLWVTPERLMLKYKTFKPMYADFNVKTWQKRHQEGKKQGLIKACKPHAGLKIIDTSAGWGRDAALLASFGAEVIMLERHPIMATLLQDALDLRDDISQQRLQLSCHFTDAQTFLLSLPSSEWPDVIYLDPMHPERQKSALVKKDLQVLQHMIGPDEDALSLLQVAMKRTRDKVVVKWPVHQPPLLPAHAHIEGKTIRFDIYRHSPCTSSRA